MARGEVLWFDGKRGYGFIRPEMGPRDVFLHVSALAETGLETVVSGVCVEFDLVQIGDGRLVAQYVQVVEKGCAGRQEVGGRAPEER